LQLLLKCLFGFIFLFMVVMTVRTSLRIPLWPASFAGNAWATPYDAYFGFLSFFCWVGWRGRSRGLPIFWFILIMTPGNIAMSLYVLLSLFPLRSEAPVGAMFRQKVA